MTARTNSRRVLPGFTPEDERAWRVTDSELISPEQAEIRLSNDMIASGHLKRLKDRVRYALQDITVPAIERIYFDGINYPSKLTDGSSERFCWFQDNPGLGNSHYGPMQMPPLGTPRWCYVETQPKPAFTALKLQWKVTDAEIARLFAYWEYRSILSPKKPDTWSISYAACIDESHGRKRRQVAASEKSQLTLMAWGLLNWIDDMQAPPLNGADQLMYDEHNYSVTSLALRVTDIVPLTEHEAATLSHRAHLCRLLRIALEDTWNDFKEHEYSDWNKEERQLEKHSKQQERDQFLTSSSTPSGCYIPVGTRQQRARLPKRKAEDATQYANESLITEDGSPDASVQA